MSCGCTEDEAAAYDSMREEGVEAVQEEAIVERERKREWSLGSEEEETKKIVSVI